MPRVTLLDGDGSRVDVPWFDVAFLPADADAPAPVDRTTLGAAGVAFQAATCWVAEPEYAARRLAEPRRRCGQDHGRCRKLRPRPRSES